ncbi:cytochrome P450 [Hypoxylon rubiginosum]|uniref:Cytochrome P450 n=1 Tax=Hypoxylon rubiginosum TaxID=110542 RepID=A0ACC0DND0_9PEZI|nr:cytochrome P450 [Hypoxylon rubiginosum]
MAVIEVPYSWSSLSIQQYGLLLASSINIYAFTRCVYLLFFHPLAKYPGPKIAAISNVWYGYQWLSGRYPWAMQRVLREYGDVVRVAPNELVFISPKAYTDIYTSSINGRPAFVKSDMLDTGDKHEGLASERNIDKHRAARKQLSPAFSPRALREAEPKIHAHANEFVNMLVNSPAAAGGEMDITPWFERATCDLGGAVTLNHNFDNIKTGKNHLVLESLNRIGHFFTVLIVMRRFPLLYPLSYFLLPPKVALSYFRAHHENKKLIRGRVERRHEQKVPDYMTQYLRDDNVIPSDEFLVSQADHLVLDHYESSSILTAGMYFLMSNPDAMAKLQAELRGRFQAYENISDSTLQELPYLGATIEEIMRLHTNVPYGLPRISPGYTIDGHYVAKGVVVSSCAYATTHSDRYFREPYEFRPQRWLPASHPQYDGAFASDDRAAFRPFSVGSRNCLGQAMAYVVMRIMFGKLCWKFDWELVNKDINWDRDLRLYMIWRKPPVVVRLVPFKR